jgi:hypothetical protein
LARRYFEQSAKQQYGPAECELGICYQFGFGIERNVVQAVEYYERSVSHDPTGSGVLWLGLCCEFGEGMAKDLSKARECYERGCDGSGMVSESRNCYGFCLEHGMGSTGDLGKAAMYYQMSAEDGNSVGSFRYALCLQFGRGIEIDLDDALEYYEASSESGGRRERDAFRCLRSLGLAEFDAREFPGLLEPSLEVVEECRTYRPHRSALLVSDFTVERDHHTTSSGRLGAGRSSQVELVEGPKEFRRAIKYLEPSSDPSTFVREIDALSRLHHPCVISLLGYVLPDADGRAEIHLEYAAHGSLEQILIDVRLGLRPKWWTSTHICVIICGIVLGLRYVHQSGFIHQDLKPSNILINGRYRALLADFGTTRETEVDLTPDGVSGTIQYAAPEQLMEISPTTKADVFSLGLILYELVVGSRVFLLSESPFSIIRRLRSRYLPPLPDSVFPWVRDLIVSCLSTDPDVRPTCDDLLLTIKSHQFMILEGVKPGKVSAYVGGLEQWERDQSLLDSIHS